LTGFDYAWQTARAAALTHHQSNQEITMFRLAISTLALLAVAAAPVATTQAQGTSGDSTVTVAGSNSWCC
jgi:hypothetical protein